METKRKCPACGDALSYEKESDGLCPACLFELALASPSLVAELDDEEAPTLTLSEDGTFAPGEVVGERYRIRALLGRGGMGEVWRAFDLKLRVDIALKAVRPWIENPQILETLRQEVRTARQVMAPNVCRIFDLIEVDGRELVSMEYVDGMTLLDLLRERGPLELTEAREIASQFLAGLEAIHHAGLVHRDVKPENIMVTRSGRVVVMDFGIARGLLGDRTSTVAGTPAYMPPEQTRGGPVSSRTDVFSAGVVLAEMVAPEGLKTAEARRRIWEGVHREPPEVADTAWKPVVAKAIAAMPDQRYPSASAVARALEEVTLRAAGDEDLRPYPGLASFTEADAEYFFGRELEIEEMWKKLQRPHLLGLIGPSGAGKSSFLRAGLLASMPEGWHAVVATPTDRPLTALAQALAAELVGDETAIRELPRFDQPEVALAVVGRWRRRCHQALVVVDQFEELFTQNPPEVQEEFSRLLARLALEADVHVLLAMRDDFLFHCSDRPALAPIFSELTPLRAPAGAALRRAVVQPALKCGYRFENDGLVDEILSEVEGERGALPLLAFATSQLWERRDRDRGLLTREAYGEIGGVGGALAQHAERTLAAVGAERLPFVRELFRNLVTAEGTRATRDREELLSIFPEDQREPAAEVLAALVGARLVNAFELPGDEPESVVGQRVEIIHESLLSHWPRLVRWQTQDADSAQLRDQLRQAAEMWRRRGRPEDLLWTGTSFKEYELWRERYAGGLSDTEESFVTAMTARTRRRRRQRRLALSAVIALLIGFGAVVTTLWRESETARNKAEAAALLAEASHLVALGRLALEDDSTAALAYATKSLELADTPTARRFALEALWRSPAAFVLDEDLAWEPRFSPNGEWLAVGGTHGRLALWSRAGGAPRRLEGQLGYAVPIGFSRDSSRLVSSARRVEGHEDLRLWSVGDGRTLETWPVAGVPEWATFFDAAAERVVTAEATPAFDAIRWRAWPLTVGSEPVVLHPGEPPLFSRGWCGDPGGARFAFCLLDGGLFVGDLSRPSLQSMREIWPSVEAEACAFGQTSEIVAAVTSEGKVALWPLAPPAGEPIRTFHTPGGAGGSSMALSPDESRLALASKEQAVYLWDLTGPPDAEPVTLGRGRELTLAVTFDPSGNWLATGNTDGAAILPVAAGRPSELLGHGASVSNVVFTPDSGRLLSASFDRSVRLWPLSFDAGAEAQTLMKLAAGIETLALHPAGDRVLVSTHQGLPTLASVDGGDRIALDGIRWSFWASAFDPTGRWAAAGGGGTKAEDALIRLWDLEGGEPRWSEELGRDVLEPARTLDAGDGRAILDLVFTSAEEIVSAGAAGIVRWSLADGSFESLFDQPVARLAAGADGRTLIARLGDNVLGSGPVVRLEGGGEPRPLATHGKGVTALALDAAGKVLVTGDENGVVRVGPADGGEPHLLLGHTARIASVAISPDGRWIASGGDDNSIRVWPMPDLKEPPLQGLPTDELLAKLHSFTNLRAVADPGAETGWTLKVGPFPGWEEVPRW